MFLKIILFISIFVFVKILIIKVLSIKLLRDINIDK